MENCLRASSSIHLQTRGQALNRFPHRKQTRSAHACSRTLDLKKKKKILWTADARNMSTSLPHCFLMWSLVESQNAESSYEYKSSKIEIITTQLLTFLGNLTGIYKVILGMPCVYLYPPYTVGISPKNTCLDWNSVLSVHIFLQPLLNPRHLRGINLKALLASI